MSRDLNKRIAIIGAGPAGLSAAEALKEKGYTNVTLIEKADRAGGKCCSIEYKGRSYELGAGIISENNTTIRALVEKFHIPVARVEFDQSLYLDAATGEELPKSTRMERLALRYQLFVTYRNLVRRYHAVTRPGFEHVPMELSAPFTEWAREMHIPLVAKEFAHFFTGWGYGYFDEVPAAYALKYNSWEVLKSFITKKVYKFPNGIQTLWTAVAKAHHVLYSTTIQKILRDQEVVITTDTGELIFDELIITSSLDDALLYLDDVPQEKILFSQILTCDYRTYACVISGFPKKSGYVPGNYTPTRAGHPVFWYARYADSDLYTFYVLGDWKVSDEVVAKHIADLIRPLGGTLERVHTVAQWKYFPHVSPEAMRAGYFDRLESLQGQNHTYYMGELLNFSTVDQSAWYAKTLVERLF